MSDRFHMRITDLFRFQDGRTVLTGFIEEGSEAVLMPGSCDIVVDGDRVATVSIQPEIPVSRSSPHESEERSVATRDDTTLSLDIIAKHDCRLEGAMRLHGARSPA